MSGKDDFKNQLSEMIDLLQVYCPGKISKENVECLCQILGLETFIDNLSANAGTRLSIASKIIVIDIDFDNSSEHLVKDAKLVLASNFDNFNYYNAENKTNILFNSLKSSNYSDLSIFTKNLKFLRLLDAYSNTSLDDDSENNSGNGELMGKTQSGGTSPENNLHPSRYSVSSGNTNGRMSNSMNNSPADRSPFSKMRGNKQASSFDLFRYYTNLEDYLIAFLAEFEPYLTITSNVNDIFGIYFINKKTGKTIMKLSIKERKPSDNSPGILQEFQYQQNKWVCENPNKVIEGLFLALDIIDPDLLFMEDLVSPDLVLDTLPGKTYTVPTTNSDHVAISGSRSIQMTFTSAFHQFHTFNVSNENLESLKDITKWALWFQSVLAPSFNKCVKQIKLRKAQNKTNHGGLHRLSGENRRPSLSIMKEEGIGELNMHELLKNSTPDEDVLMDDVLPVAESLPADTYSDSLKLENTESNGKQEALNSKQMIILSEDYVYDEQKGSVTFYDNEFSRWAEFSQKSVNS
ncbi:hypothetical protein ACO0QE_003277 [Hanseniaspora vineae]